MTAAACEHAEANVGIDGGLLQKSRDFCRDLTRREAKNFYYGLKLLPEPKRSAMYALYAYMRLVDDIADDDSNGRTLAQRKADLEQWEMLTRQTVAAANCGPDETTARVPRGHILWPAFWNLVRTHRVPLHLFEEMIAGQRQDLEPVAIADFQALYDYCYRVASVVGVASLYVWGFQGGEETIKLGVERGIAFQLTNILRDLREDAARGRCYLPADEMARFGVSREQIVARKSSAEFCALMEYQVRRTEEFYARSSPLESRITVDARPTLRAMTLIYHSLLQQIAVHPEAVLIRRLRLSTFAKLMIGWRALRSR
jgi:phytoene synthase